MTSAPPVGSVASIWRYPVKSMLGEALDVATVTARGVVGDRAYAVVDGMDGEVASAKDIRRWPHLFRFAAAFDGETGDGAALPPVLITLPDGSVVTTRQPDLATVLSAHLGRSARLAGPGAQDGPQPTAPFVDEAVVHVLTTASLSRLEALQPQGRFDVRRFRPNVVVETPAGSDGFVEDDWVGRTITLGPHVRLRVTGPCARCVMTTLAQGDLPKDRTILRTAAQHHDTNVGVYAVVERGGQLRRGDQVTVEALTADQPSGLRS